MQILEKDLLKIICDPYGNYAVTELITRWPNNVCKPIFCSMKGSLYELCKKKYSSPVVEKCIEHAPANIR